MFCWTRGGAACIIRRKKGGPRHASVRRRSRTPAPETLPAEDGSTPDPTALPESMPEVMADGYAYIGYVRIPSLELELPVLSDWDYEKLRIAPCRQFGSLYTEDLVIAAHNYDRHFGHLKELEPGAAASFTDMAGNRMEFVLAEIRILDPNDPVSEEDVSSSGHAMVLYTCTKGGQSRVVCFFDKVQA